MIIKKIDDRYFFINDNNGNIKYKDYISKKYDNFENDNVKINEIDDLKTSLKIASITGKYIVNMISGICKNCGIQYSVSENSLVWICPICESFNISDKKYKISVENATRSKIYINIKR